MLQWLLFAAMTGIAVLAVLWPLARARTAVPGAHGHDAAVYRDQLSEIERDQARGLVGPAEAEAARAEVGRRLLAATAAAAEARSHAAESLTRRRRLAAVAGLVFVPALALPLYLTFGSPDLPAQPLAARLAAPVPEGTILIARLENHLAMNPDDARGWEILAPIYARLQRFQDAAQAYTRAIAIAGSNARRQSGLGESLTAAAGGVVTAEARAAFEAALAADPNELGARFYLARAAAQDGDRAEALRRLEAIASAIPAGSQEAAIVRAEMARLSSESPERRP
jgi:cytochrome c-type biogenesis protein CcmH